MIQISHYETVTQLIKYKLENNQRKQNGFLFVVNYAGGGDFVNWAYCSYRLEMGKQCL